MIVTPQVTKHEKYAQNVFGIRHLFESQIETWMQQTKSYQDLILSAEFQPFFTALRCANVLGMRSMAFIYPSSLKTRSEVQLRTRS